jgi:hypothetical protein
MELTEQITRRITELTGEAELLRKQLADAEHELERLVIAGQGADIPQVGAAVTPPRRSQHLAVRAERDGRHLPGASGEGQGLAGIRRLACGGRENGIVPRDAGPARTERRKLAAARPGAAGA